MVTTSSGLVWTDFPSVVNDFCDHVILQKIQFED